MNHAGQLERRQPENFIGQEDILYSFGGLTIASLDIEKINDFWLISNNNQAGTTIADSTPVYGAFLAFSTETSGFTILALFERQMEGY